MDRLDPKGLEIIRRFEGLRLDAYRDPVGVLTIGWGHTGPDVVPGLAISRQRAEALLKADVMAAAAAVDRLVRVPLARNERAALVSFTFNVGVAAVAGSTLLRLLNAGDREGAGAEFGRWVHGTVDGRKVRLDGLVRRRAAEAGLFLGRPVGTAPGVTPSGATPPPGSGGEGGATAARQDTGRCSSAAR
jgi:lysozyme